MRTSSRRGTLRCRFGRSRDASEHRGIFSLQRTSQAPCLRCTASRLRGLRARLPTSGSSYQHIERSRSEGRLPVSAGAWPAPSPCQERRTLPTALRVATDRAVGTDPAQTGRRPAAGSDIAGHPMELAPGAEVEVLPLVWTPTSIAMKGIGQTKIQARALRANHIKASRLLAFCPNRAERYSIFWIGSRYRRPIRRLGPPLR